MISINDLDLNNILPDESALKIFELMMCHTKL